MNTTCISTFSLQFLCSFDSQIYSTEKVQFAGKQIDIEGKKSQ